MTTPDELFVSCLGLTVRLRCHDAGISSLLNDNFGAMASERASAGVAYEIVSPRAGAAGVIRRRGAARALEFADHGELIHELEGDLVRQLQLLRARYAFLHSAVLVREGAATLLVGRSGAGKSTTCWGLLHHGFEYLSDELAPVDSGTSTVHAYPHALCVKRRPSPDYPLPAAARRTSKGYHVPVSALPFAGADVALPITRVLFVEHDAKRAVPSLTRIGGAEAAARLYPNFLNALAHSNAGADATAALARAAACFRLASADLAATCESIVAL